MDNLEKTLVLEESDEETTLKLGSTTALCPCSNCKSSYSSSECSNYFTACSQLDLSFVELSSENQSNEILKRSISCSNFTQQEAKKSKSSLYASSQIENQFSISKKVVFSEDIWNEDVRLSKSFYYNRIDETDFEIETFCSSILQKAIDKITDGKSKFSLEHYYHLEKKKREVKRNTLLYEEFREKFKSFIDCNNENTNDMIWNEMHKQTAKRRLEDQLQIKNISEDDLKSFSEFLEEVYKNLDLLD